MKKVVLILFLLQFFFSAFAQEEASAALFYEVQGIYTRAISQSDLKSVTTLSDINERYPTSWIKEYISVEILASCNGVMKRAMGENEILNAEQKDILKNADYDTEVVVDVKYMPNNMLKHNDAKTINFTFSVLPEVQASFLGGSEQMMEYLKENIEDKIPRSIDIENIKWAAVRFTVDTAGKINTTKVIGTSEFEDIDKIIMDAICGMPKWTPAKDSKNKKVAQEFEFIFGNTATICTLNLYLASGSF